MASVQRPPRIWIDFEMGAAYGSTVDSVRIFDEYRAQFTVFDQAWLFADDQAPLSRGFYFSVAAHAKYGVPPGQRGPHLVLIDGRGDQLWLDGVAGGDDERAAGAAAVLRRAGFVLPTAGTSGPLSGYAEMCFRDGRLLSSRPAGQVLPVSPPGKTAVLNGRLVNRLEFDKGSTTPVDLSDLWLRATEPGGWLDRVAALTLYESRAASEQSGHTGCQLIAAGVSGRELWLQLPEPDGYESLSPFPRLQYQGSYLEYQAVVRRIFQSVGAEIDQDDDRPWWRRLLGLYDPPPTVIRWPA